MGVLSSYICCNSLKFPISGGREPLKLFPLNELQHKKVKIIQQIIKKKLMIDCRFAER